MWDEELEQTFLNTEISCPGVVRQIYSGSRVISQPVAGQTLRPATWVSPSSMIGGTRHVLSMTSFTFVDFKVMSSVRESIKSFYETS